MTTRIAQHLALRVGSPLLILLGVLATPLHAQDRLKTMPGYARYEQMRAQIPAAVKLGAVFVDWAEDGKSFTYDWDGKQYRYDLSRHRATVLGDAPARTGRRGFFRGRGGGPARGRQFTEALSPDSTLKAVYRDRNLWLSNADGSNEVAITTDGSDASRVKYGTASWVYGEELGQRTAMWWSPDGKKLAYYRFDESKVPDYYLQLNQTEVQDSLDVEAYPKPGVPNPVVDLFVYDLATRKSTQIDVRDGQPFENDVVGYYAYHVDWTPDGRELTLNRTNRRQNVMEFTACNPDTGKCRAIVHEEWPTGWVENSPYMHYLKDGKRFLWASERTGFNNLYLYDLSGKLLVTLTNHPFEVDRVLRVDEKAGQVWYTARDGDNFMKVQLHRVGLNGKNDRRLTDPAFNHSVTIAPDGKHFIDVAQTHDQPPVTRLLDNNGKVLAEIATSDLTKFDQLGLKKAEMFTYLAADGKTRLYGLLSFPSNFDPSHKYPVLVPVYGGPASASNTARETFVLPNPLTEYGFLVVNLDSRATPGMGKHVLDDLYLKLGQTEIDDMAQGIKALWDRPYFDKDRVGMFGTSYGGYSSVMSLLRYPDVYAAASASSPPTDWRNYDTIYTERYMWIPQENKAGYDAGSAMTYAENLRGRLMIYYGTADNNVHPSNSMQLITALQRDGKSFDVQVGPDRGHSGLNQDRMMEFFIQNLILNGGSTATH